MKYVLFIGRIVAILATLITIFGAPVTIFVHKLGYSLPQGITLTVVATVVCGGLLLGAIKGTEALLRARRGGKYP